MVDNLGLGCVVVFDGVRQDVTMSDTPPPKDELLPALLELASIQKDMLVVLGYVVRETGISAAEPALGTLHNRSREVIKWLLERRKYHGPEAGQ